MTIDGRLIVVCWLFFLAYWLISMRGVKKTLRRRSWGWGIVVRLVAIVVIYLSLGSSWATSFFGRFRRVNAAPSSPILAPIGVVLCVAGVGLAIWARRYIGRNWGMPMSVKDNPELVTGGPYQYVRHPIYSGVLLAMLGSAFASGPVWLMVFVLFFAYFFYSARVEERIMTKQFPAAYPAYKTRTKMIIPFVL